MGELELYGGSIITLLHYHYSISLEIANTQKSDMLLLKISSQSVNGSGVVTAVILKFTKKVI